MEFDLTTFEKELAFLVNIDSGSLCPSGVNQVADWFAARISAMGWPVEYVQADPQHYGKSVYTWFGDPNALDLLILSHTDTVFPEGTAKARPFASKDGLFTGPGVADMKAGCLMTLHALEQLHKSGRLKGSVGFFLNGEHELSCPTTRPFIEEKSQLAKVVVSTEPARIDGSCVRQRKGILRYTMRFHGRSAHSGVDPQNGACAITELARKILALRQMDDFERGINVNPGVVKGGVSVNAIPASAECQIDVRVIQMEDAHRIDERIHKLVETSVDPSIRIELEGGITRPPLVPTVRGDVVIEGINKIARGYGLDLKWSFSGGGSDASFASAFGIPALCGLGPVGGHYHTEKEFLQTVDLRERLSIFRDMVEAICNGSI
ncbi:MAG TPA: M20 family metallopeptidase [Oceanipulchritudo sp.]|nr:M20 family metallopeptidase [Oceanipulchritudo sp.]